jgi:MHS family citrate/tricarballylate:H+ symporter-like MFS transporter
MYAVAISLCGGTTQFAIKALTDLTRSPLTPAWYMTGAVLLGGIAMALMHETAPVTQERNALAAYLAANQHP